MALSALTDEQKAEMAKASDQLGALIVSADASVVDAATSEKAAHEGKLSVSFSVDKRYEGRASCGSTGKPTARSKRRRLRWKEVSRA